jgi:hypothetical protein
VRMVENSGLNGNIRWFIARKDLLLLLPSLGAHRTHLQVEQVGSVRVRVK